MCKKIVTIVIALILTASLGSGVLAGQAEEQQYNTTYQLSPQEIYDMNDGKALFVYNDEGYLSTMIGKYYEEKINDQEDAVESLFGIASLLGIDKGADFFCVYKAQDDDNYTYYTFQQRYGGNTVVDATLKVVVDPEGYTAGISSSFTPGIGRGENTEGISAEEAEAMVKEMYADHNLQIIDGYTEEIAVTFNNVVHNSWAVYTNNPDMTLGFDMPYLEHFVTKEGEYLQVVPTASLTTSNQDSFKTEQYFENLEAEDVTFNLVRGDGQQISVTVPVSYNSENGLYYLADPSRRIMVADYANFAFGNWLEFISSESKEEWKPIHLAAYANYIAAYDFYARMGLKSVDGFETPILVTVGYCDEYGNSVNNACYYGNNSGWACFAVSDEYRMSEALDIVGHEYTHGVTRQSMQGTAYYNEYGSINEAFSDIMGNLCQFMTEKGHVDEEWLVGETSNTVYRSMKNPNRYGQPTFIGDVFYEPDVINPTYGINDNGGVHVNNSLISQMAYKLDQAGMSHEEQCSLWLTTIELLTPLSNYDDLHACMLWSCEINGLTDYSETVNQMFKDANMDGNRLETYRETSRNFCGRVQFTVDETLAAGTNGVVFIDSNGTETYAYPDKNGYVSALLPIGSYMAKFLFVTPYFIDVYNLTVDGWEVDGEPGIIPVTDGCVFNLTNLYYAEDTTVEDPTEAETEEATTEEPVTEEEPATEEVAEPATKQATGSDSILDLFEYDGGYFKLLMPNGWRLEVNGAAEAGNLSFKLFNPMNPSMQAFCYKYLAPFAKGVEYEEVYNCPVLITPSAKQLLRIWDDCIRYQEAKGEPQFTPLYDIKGKFDEYYEGEYRQYGLTESRARAMCSTDWDDDCIIEISCAIDEIDHNDLSLPMAIYDLKGVISPADQYLEVYEELMACLDSIEIFVE